MQEPIIKALDSYFKVLKQELAVCFISTDCLWVALYSPIIIGCTRKYFLHTRYLVNESSAPFPSHYSTLDTSREVYQWPPVMCDTNHVAQSLQKSQLVFGGPVDKTEKETIN
jgi:hypothetical protein